MNQTELVRKYVKQKVELLRHVLEKSRGKAELALLRRGVGKEPGELPSLWGMLLEQMPEELQGKGKTPSRGEWAVYTALTLYALHQQGQGQSMNQPGMTLGRAIHMLVPAGNQDAEERVLRRFNQMATSSDMVELAQHLRGIIELLRANGIPLDYVDLSGDLYNYQLVDYQNTVRLKWGREYYYVKQQDNKEE
ncbi:type I-E CRISPR-associated protein Cse2/CasB, partial [Acidaminococcus timonensis]|uniref:type I-E CRISPR-associated protein Cse2/CasB n=1 Tax=Acidaminococcus timonensis TaxID=1871002 RepID=UPI0026F2F040